MAHTIPELIKEYVAVLEYEDRSHHTIAGKKSALNQFNKWKEATYPNLHINDIKPRHMREYFLYRRKGGLGKGAEKQAYIHLNVFFKWVHKEYRHLLKKNPLDKVTKPVYVPPLIEFPEKDVIEKMIETCDDTFIGRRDRLLLLLYRQTGGRASEVLGLTEKDFNPDEQTITVLGKRRKIREIPYGDETAIAFQDYLEVREDHAYADQPELFVGHKGPFGYGGLRLMFRKRSLMVSDKALSPHKFRHAFVHLAKMHKISEDALMELMGWSSRMMLDHYARSLRPQRAKEEYRQKLQNRE